MHIFYPADEVCMSLSMQGLCLYGLCACPVLWHAKQRSSRGGHTQHLLSLFPSPMPAYRDYIVLLFALHPT